MWALWLIAIHSICYGVGLILFPPSFFAYFGFDLPQTFFADQGGVFHILISSVYILAAIDLPHASRLIGITCFVKFSAFIFLMAWYIFGLPSWIILVSGILDLLMGLVVWFLYAGYRKSVSADQS
ncbi:MAG: hypothetical protein D4R67_01380 [Bacteroidetes bacterium]|nr:MAG: hypothetical protein D4R67_01380 [Bacteroidota bacterium]